MENTKSRRDFHWEVIISMALLIGTILGVTILLHLSIQSDVKSVYEEMKDFHGRLCAIEERNKGK